MQHRAHARLPREDAVQQRFGRRSRRVRLDVPPAPVDEHEIAVAEPPLIFAAGGQQKLQRLAIHDRAVVAARPQRPAAAVKLSPNLLQPTQFGVKPIGHRLRFDREHEFSHQKHEGRRKSAESPISPIA
jgi:hypothetical protein